MQIRHVSIENFRGIKQLSWTISGPIVCLIGPGDSTKSTILTAIDYTLSPRWKIDFNDSDFYDGYTSPPIAITVTVGDLPAQLKSDAKFGLHLRGWGADGLHDEPRDHDELVISVRLSVDASLEPAWSVVDDRHPEGRAISANDRDAFGVARIGESLDRHLTWTRGSALARITEKGDDLTALLAGIARTARSSIADTALPKFQAAAEQVATLGKDLGVRARTGFKAHLDIKSVDVNAGAMSLHDGDVPARLAGTGTRRLIALALQSKSVSDGALGLIDEVEHGLEPHRLRRLLRALRRASGAKTSPRQFGQLFMTTHSPTAIDELPCSELWVVRNDAGVVNVSQIDEAVQNTVHRAPDIFLSSGIIVCEGITEIGLCRALDEWWISSGGHDPLSVRGISLADGKGAGSEPFVLAMSGIGYSVAFFADSDRALNPTQAELESAGASVFLWDGDVSLEERVMLDLPWEGVLELMALLIAEGKYSEDAVRAGACKTFSLDKTVLHVPVASWTDSPELRQAIGSAAKTKAWFKNADMGEKLGNLVVKHFPNMASTPFAMNVDRLRAWIDEHE
jgi:putative ATP-dependent endonuclease of OLD family